jgi:hypothetical protein
MAKEKLTVSEEFQQKLRNLLREELKGVDVDEMPDLFEEIRKGTTKEMKTVRSSIVNTEFQEYVENFLDIQKKAMAVFENGKEIVALTGQNRKPTPVKMVGCNLMTGDIFINDNGKSKVVKKKSVIDDISKIPVSKTKPSSSKPRKSIKK